MTIRSCGSESSKSGSSSTVAPSSKFAGTDELAFDHRALVQEAAHAMLIGDDAALGHKLAAQWLASAGETNAMVLAEHWEAAREPAQALAAWARAAEQALEGNDYTACVARAERGVRCEARGAALGRLRDLRPRPTGGLATTPRWQRAPAKPSASFHATPTHGQRQRASSRSRTSASVKLDGVVAVGNDLVACLAHPSPVKLSAAARTASALALAGKRDESNRLLDAALRASTGEKDPATLARLDQGLREPRFVRWPHGRVRGALRSRPAARVSPRPGDRRLSCVAQLNVGHGLLELGVSQDAAVSLRAAVDEGERLGLRNVATAASQNLGWAMFRLHRPREALALLEAHVGRGVRRARQPAPARGSPYIYIARILLGDDSDGGSRCGNEGPRAR